ncbi:MAG: hypothetical protein HY744_19645, partial [Deltaproteobacteria bacterium]|nr:hypothetical protein [Deltaproteobacteria bacterium]
MSAAYTPASGGPLRVPTVLWAVAAVTAAVLVGFAGCAFQRSGTMGQECTSDSQCPADPPCQIAVCTPGGFCEIEQAPNAPLPEGEQKPGDCKKLVCQAGEKHEVDDEGDVPPPVDPCKPYRCEEGGPVQAPEDAEGTVCQKGQAEGHCCQKGQDEIGCQAGECVVQCTLAEHCNDENPCTTEACDFGNGKCVFDKLDGVPLPIEAQTVGDCRVLQCVGGEKKSLPDNNDVPFDGKDCTEDSCNEGTPVFESLPLGAECKQDGGRVCDGDPKSPACVACNVPDDCVNLPKDDECHKRVCNNHNCQQQYTPEGKPVSQQKLGDCLVVVCDGKGGQKTKSDDDDTYDDKNECTKDECVGDVPKNTAVGNGAACGQNLAFQCFGGLCGCNVAGDCLGQDNECGTRICATKQCGWNYAVYGKLANSQTQGDCLKKICDGKGAIISVPDDSDIHDDAQECTDNLCASGVVQHPGKKMDTPCVQGGGKFCDGKGACVQCNSPFQCPGGKPCETVTCDFNKCGLKATDKNTLAPPSEQTAKDCKRVLCDGLGATFPVADASDLPEDNKECTKNECKGMDLSFPPKDVETPCSENNGKYCNGDPNSPACVECTKSDHCKAPNTCQNWSCGCTPKTCQQLGKTCGPVDNGCNVTIDCNNNVKDGAETDKDCGGSVSACPTRCGTDQACQGASDCQPNFYCDSLLKKCYGKLAQGKPCTEAAECASGFCPAQDKVCCNNACGSTCEACTAAKKGSGLDGTCGYVTKGTSPDNDCVANNLCDGNGLCKLVNGQGCNTDGQCLNALCRDLYCCNATCGGNCDACNVGGKLGICSVIAKGQAGSPSCTPYLCDGVLATCPAACAVDGDCAASAYCDGSKKCVAKKANGAVCVGNNECTNGNCIDGYCCNNACGNACDACNVGGKLGACSPIAKGLAGSPTCSPYLCDGVNATCPAACTVDGDCAAGNYCDAGKKCSPKKAKGASCVGNNECTSGYCVDLYCCDTACGDKCDACNLGGKLGTCSPVAKGAAGSPKCEPYLCDGNNASCPSTCGGDSDCTAGYYCDGADKCVLYKLLGVACGGNYECASGNCADGVCCDGACNNKCEACTKAKNGGSDGTCDFVTKSTDPDTECSSSERCDGAGACKKIDGEGCGGGGECLSGFCPAQDKKCCDKACGGTCEACANSKTGKSDGTCDFVTKSTDLDDECTDPGSPDVCDGAGACKKIDGQSCGGGGECMSGFCPAQDKVCCDKACNTVCVACLGSKTGGSNGTCANVSNGTDPDT